ncbi:hypothetical protein D3C76_1276780 [compost metagenome]
MGTGLGVELQGQGLQRRPGRIQYGHVNVGCDGLHRIPGVLELAPDDFQRHPIPRSVQRAVSESKEFGVVDFAVVVEVLRDENAALFILANHE